MHAQTFAIRGEGSNTLELDIYDVIGESFWSESVSAKAVRRALKESKAELIKLRVNSRGGDVVDGFAIYNLLAEHPARVEADVDALAASMASVILMAADKVRVASSAMIMIHNPWTIALGEADDLRAYADVMDKWRDNIVDAYVARTGQDRDKIVAMMAAETWLTAEEAKELGFADEVKPAKQLPKKAQARAFASIDLSDFAAVPEHFQRAVASARTGSPRVAAQLELDTTPVSEPPAPTPLPSSAAREDEPKEKSNMKPIIQALALEETADEATVVAAIKKLQASARAGSAIEQLLGASGDAAVGAVRALKETAAQHTELAATVSQLQVKDARRDFDAVLASGLSPKERKLTPATAKHYTDRFEAAVAAGEGAQAVVDDLRGFLAAAPRLVSAAASGAANSAGAGDPAMQHGGKTFEAMSPRERHALKSENSELYNMLREDAASRGAI